MFLGGVCLGRVQYKPKFLEDETCNLQNNMVCNILTLEHPWTHQCNSSKPSVLLSVALRIRSVIHPFSVSDCVDRITDYLMRQAVLYAFDVDMFFFSLLLLVFR